MSVQISYKKQFLFGILLCLIIISSVEIFLRVYDYSYPACSFYDSDVFGEFSNDLKRDVCHANSKLIWNNSPLRLEPLQDLKTTNVNSEGFRGPELRDDSKIRIFLIGGSTMFGVGSSSDDKTIPGFLGEYISKEFLDVEIINAGIPGADSFTETELIKNKLLDYSPKILIIYDGWNDLQKDFEESDDVEEDITTQLIRAINRGEYQTPKILIQHYFNWKHDTVEVVFDSNYINEKSIAWKNNWKNTCENLNGKGIETVLILQPILGSGSKVLSYEEQEYYSHYDSKTMNEYYEIYAEQLDELKNSCTKVYDYRDTYDKVTETLFFDAGHTGDLGNNIIAKRIFSDVLPIISEQSKED